MSVFNQPQINLLTAQNNQPIHQGYIPPGMFIDIDQKIYSPKDIYAARGYSNPLPMTSILKNQEYQGINRPSETGLIMGLQPQPIIKNFGTYLYDPLHGTAPNQL
tara:strand:+ start:953 stop:1267 length:315 start_codon:yes stop_codon:yes gene_type:complete